jgi:hypothetical protein
LAVFAQELAGYAKIDHEDHVVVLLASLADHEVCRLDVPVNEPELVEICKKGETFTRTYNFVPFSPRTASRVSTAQ